MTRHAALGLPQNIIYSRGWGVQRGGEKIKKIKNKKYIYICTYLSQEGSAWQCMHSNKSPQSPLCIQIFTIITSVSIWCELFDSILPLHVSVMLEHALQELCALQTGATLWYCLTWREIMSEIHKIKTFLIAMKHHWQHHNYDFHK